jgi:hypothetical protein
MANLFVLTVIDQSQASKAAETQLIHDACQKAAQMVRSQKVIGSGNVLIEKGVQVASWTYTGTASS